MSVIDMISQYGLIVVMSGLAATIICGIVKLPIIKSVKDYGKLKNQDCKIVGDRVRNVCSLIVCMCSVIFVAIWYIATQGFNSLLQIKVYAEMLGAFTCSKLIYMSYEGVGKFSIKKFIHNVLHKLKKFKVVNDNKNTNLPDAIQNYLINGIHLPLTPEQLDGLQEVLQNIKAQKQ